MPWDAIEAGVDIVEIDRIGDLARRYGDRFRRRVYTEREWADAGGRADSLAARFAAKEATIKALGSREPALREIEVVRPAWSKPRLRLWGRAAEIAREQAVRQIALSLSHAQQHAVAVVVLVRAGEAVSWDGAVLEAAALAAGRSGLGSDSPGPGHADGRAGDR
ncbi:MAG: holo-ACP synthase [Chloroflexi bacterium]|nr:holo-ACP synthase [Chloroflexota bacterium]